MNYEIELKNQNGVYVVSSRVIANQLEKKHADVLESLEKILTNGDFRSLILANKYKDKKGEYRKEYLLTKDGFILYMFNIQGYLDFKMAYINEFNRMEKELQQLTLPKPQEKKEFYIDSIEIANFLRKPHYKLLDEISCCYIFNQSTFKDMFVLTKYDGGNGTILDKYRVTRKGCDFLSAKMSEKKEALFKVFYLEKFHEMEMESFGTQQLNLNDYSYNKMIELIFQAYKYEQEIENIHVEKLQPIYKKIEEINNNKMNLMFTPFNLLKYNDSNNNVSTPTE